MDIVIFRQSSGDPIYAIIVGLSQQCGTDVAIKVFPHAFRFSFGQTILTGFPDSTIYQWANMQK